MSVRYLENSAFWCGPGYSVWFLDFFFQAEDGIRDSVASRGLGDVYKRQHMGILQSDSKV